MSYTMHNISYYVWSSKGHNKISHVLQFGRVKEDGRFQRGNSRQKFPYFLSLLTSLYSIPGQVLQSGRKKNKWERPTTVLADKRLIIMEDISPTQESKASV